MKRTGEQGAVPASGRSTLELRSEAAQVTARASEAGQGGGGRGQAQKKGSRMHRAGGMPSGTHHTLQPCLPGSSEADTGRGETLVPRAAVVASGGGRVTLTGPARVQAHQTQEFCGT